MIGTSMVTGGSHLNPPQQTLRTSLQLPERGLSLVSLRVSEGLTCLDGFGGCFLLSVVFDLPLSLSDGLLG